MKKPLRDRGDILDLNLQDDEAFRQEMEIHQKEVERPQGTTKMAGRIEQLIELHRKAAECEEYLRQTKQKVVQWTAAEEMKKQTARS